MGVIEGVQDLGHCSMDQEVRSTMRFGSTAKVPSKCKLKYCRLSESALPLLAAYPARKAALAHVSCGSNAAFCCSWCIADACR